MKRTVLIVSIVALCIAPLFGFSQYLSKLYDFDTTGDFARDVFYQPDNTILIFSSAQNVNNGSIKNTYFLVQNDGTLIKKHQFFSDSLYYEYGFPGGIKRLNDGGFILPLSLQVPGVAVKGMSGLTRLNAALDTTFVHFYPDTATYYDFIYDCTVLPDGGFIMGGQRRYNRVGDTTFALIIRLDSVGNLLWKKMYQKNTTTCWANTVEALGDGRILVGALTSFPRTVHQLDYWHNSPWFMILDSAGNIIKDIIMPNGFGGGSSPSGLGGSIRRDRNGGFIHWGHLDKFIVADELDFSNMPAYVAHLDSDFNVTWLNVLGEPEIWHEVTNVKQLIDGGYLVIGEKEDTIVGYQGWFARLDKNGKVIFDEAYNSEALQNAYLEDGIQKPDGSFVFTGATYNDTMPSWDPPFDMWLVATDSNGCLKAGCSPNIVQVQKPAAAETDWKVYPNPTTGDFILSSPSGKWETDIIITDMVGNAIYSVHQTFTNGEKLNVRIPNVPDGLYTVRIVTDAGETRVIKLIKE